MCILFVVVKGSHLNYGDLGTASLGISASQKLSYITTSIRKVKDAFSKGL